MIKDIFLCAKAKRLFFLFLAFGFSGEVAAESRTRAKPIQCPSIIANREAGVYYRRSRKTAQFPFECFAASKIASNAGYKSQQQVESRDLTGWWRITASQVSNSCDGSGIGSPVNIFLQTRQRSDGIFGEMCGRNLSTRFAGFRKGNGFLISEKKTLSEPIADSRCADGKKEITYVIEYDQVVTKVDGSTRAEFVRYKQLERCATETVDPNPCAKEWQGSANFESSHHWPVVPENINDFNATCQSTLDNVCVQCHAGIGG